ncbi:hypothetical protein O6H91_23G070200 [Diphasiastrum complanatum]|uniref:Uncharacterized protein n=2 Tax=Diphasiastrum complanatum TaxID=34168 RepID=A0ACC2ADX9_DIPCM|nr:hypothetical protein O6H91_23G070200 [Diphasiastrum complanatum]
MEAAVLDAGSKYLKAGLAVPDQDPSIVIPTAMTKAIDEDLGKENGWLSDESQWLHDTVYPIQRGVVKDWDAMEDLWRYVFYTDLGWEVGSEGQVLMADPLLTSKTLKEKTVQIMFETFNVNGFYAVEQAVLSIYAVGRISGCAIDIGHGKIDIAPVWEGAVQHNAVKRLEVSGQDLTFLLGEELEKSNPQTKLDSSTVEMLKETYGITADDQEEYAKKAEGCTTVEHTLPDGQTIKIGKERYTVGEALFQPSFLGVEGYSVAEQLVRSVLLCVPSESQKPLIENIVLCGGTSTMKGFDTRFQKEASLLGTPSFRPSIIKPPEYMPENTMKNSAWIGGAILAKVVFPQNQHITKAEYDESGPSIVHRKCY